MIYRFSLIEKLLLRGNIIPHPAIDAITNVVAGRALQIAVKLEILTFLNVNRSFSAIRDKTNLNPGGLEVLLNCLIALGYVRQEGAEYLLTKRGKVFFSSNATSPMRNMVLFANHHFQQLQSLEESVKDGVVPGNLDAFQTQEEWDVFTEAMLEMAYSHAPELIGFFPKKSNYTSLLDLGGSHGFYAIEACKRFPDMAAVVLDLEPMRVYAERLIEENGMSHRIKFHSADFIKGDLGGPFDVILSANVIHGLSPKDNDLLTEKIFSAMNQGGTYIIMDQIRNMVGKSELSRLFAASMAVMLFNVAGGKTYSVSEVSDFLTKNGFSSVNAKKMKVPGFAVVSACKS